jgi:hypothetical protein
MPAGESRPVGPLSEIEISTTPGAEVRTMASLSSSQSFKPDRAISKAFSFAERYLMLATSLLPASNVKTRPNA